VQRVNGGPFGQAEVKAHDSRTDLEHGGEARLVEGDRRHGRRRWLTEPQFRV
jgi:hypothetical protein